METYLRLAAVLLLIGVLVHVAAVPVVHAVAPAVVALAVIGAGVVGGVVGYLLGQRDAELKAAEALRQELDIYTDTIEEVYDRDLETMFYNFNALWNRTRTGLETYYGVWAENIALSYGNRSCPAPEEGLKPIAEDLVNFATPFIEALTKALRDRYATAVNIIGLYVHRSATRVRLMSPHGGEITTPADVYDPEAGGWSTLTPSNSVVIVFDSREDYLFKLVVWYEYTNGKRYIGVRHLHMNPNNVLVRDKYAVLTWTVDGRPVSYYVVHNNTVVVDRDAVFDALRNRVSGLMVLRVGASGVGDYWGWSVLGELMVLKDLSDVWAYAVYRYNLMCEIKNLTNMTRPPSPQVVLPLDPEKAKDLPPELALQLYLAYLSQLSQYNWTQYQNMTPDKVNVTTGGVKIFVAGTEYFPINVPYNITVRPGVPIPLIGTWLVNGSLVFFDSYPVPAGATWEQVNGTRYYWIRYGGRTIGVGVDFEGDGVPDTYSPDYIIPETIKEWNREKKTYEEKESAEVGVKTAREWTLQTVGPTERPLGPSWPRFTRDGFDTRLLLIIVGAVLLIVLLFALNGKGKITVVR